jgi:hypothetical protein
MNPTNAMRKIAEIDLSQIKVKLMHEQSGEGWSPEHANAIEVEYRRFLCMMHMYPNENIAPLLDVDVFWHYHILDTRKYAADCQQAFGHFLHHNPNVGLGEDDAADHQAFGERMHELYQATFGEACLTGAHAAGATQTAWCSLNGDQAQSQAQTEARTKGQTAWCSLADGAKALGTAWCSLAGGANALGTAWCSLATKPHATAWCSVTAAAKGKTAWCSVTGVAAQQRTAWCSVSATKQQQTAWCSASDAAKQQHTAWCSAAAKVLAA